jgi:hypothetical protein
MVKPPLGEIVVRWSSRKPWLPKAAHEFGYCARPLRTTVADANEWLRIAGMLPAPADEAERGSKP